MNVHQWLCKSCRIVTVAILLCLSACVSGSREAWFDGRYVNKDTGGFIEFFRAGDFKYSFYTANPKRVPIGRYYFQTTSELEPRLSVVSAHAGQFKFRFSESKDKVYVSWRFSSEVIEYDRVENR
jgi:hypothetical protein